ncbi:MAG: hypothetical protein B655_1876 [Methanobacterium sp. Maddingley MBC34]|nr:MAG: hypothetical protein B655_1876 [Methanobacterium sp. Maddingley MBC34]
MSTKINRFLEIFRWVGVAIGIFFAFYWGANPQSQFNIFAVFTVVFIAGFTAIEGLFFSESASEVSGYSGGGAYQRQSSLQFLALTVTMILSLILGWGFYAYLSLLIFMLIFLTVSSLNHLYNGFKEGFVLNSFLRPILTLFLWAITLFFILPALNI